MYKSMYTYSICYLFYRAKIGKNYGVILLPEGIIEVSHIFDIQKAHTSW